MGYLIHVTDATPGQEGILPDKKPAWKTCAPRTESKNHRTRDGPLPVSPKDSTGLVALFSLATCRPPAHQSTDT